MTDSICSCCGRRRSSEQMIMLDGDRLATPAPRSTLRSATAAASGCTAEMRDKSITAQFVHNAVDKSRRNPTESNAFSGIFTF